MAAPKIAISNIVLLEFVLRGDYVRGVVPMFSGGLFWQQSSFSAQAPKIRDDDFEYEHADRNFSGLPQGAYGALIARNVAQLGLPYTKLETDHYAYHQLAS